MSHDMLDIVGIPIQRIAAAASVMNQEVVGQFEIGRGFRFWPSAVHLIHA
jgi:hypothetical protein